MGTTRRTPYTRRWVWVTVLAAALAVVWQQDVRAQVGEAVRTLEGRVLTAADEPLPGANVAVPSLGRGTTSGLDGRFTLTALPARRLEVAVSFVGFRTERVEVDVREVDAVAGRALVVRLAPEAVAVDEIVVAAQGHADLLTRGARSIAVLDAEDLADVRGQTLGAALAELPGVAVLTTGPSLAKPVVRGLTGSRVTVIHGGVAQEGQQWGREHAPEIDPFAPVEIEVIKGAASVEHGVGAIGGVVRLVPTPLPEGPGVGGELLFNGFSNNRQAAGSLLLEMGSRGPWSGRVQASVRHAGDSHAPGYVLGNTAFREATGSATLGYQRGRLGLEATARHFGTTLGLFSGAHINNLADLERAIARGRPAVEHAFGYGIDAPRQKIGHTTGSLRATWHRADGGRLDATYSAQRNHRREYDKHRGNSARAAFDLVLATHTLDASWTRRPGRFAGGDALVKAGASGMTQGNVNEASGTLIPNFRAVTGGVFTHATLVRGGWTWEAGARYDARHLLAHPRDRSAGAASAFRRATHRYGSLSGVLGALWRFGPGWSVAANIGTGWRPPGVNELYSYGVHHGTAQVEIGDETLQPERSLDASLTLRRASGPTVRPRIEAEVSAFANRIDGYLFLRATPQPSVTIRGVYPTFFHAQTDALLAGMDGSVVTWPASWLRIGASLSVVRGSDRLAQREAMRPLVDMPSDRLRLSVRLERERLGPLGHPHLDVEGVFVRRQDRVPEAFAYAPPPPGYRLLHVHLRADLPGLSPAHPAHVSLSVENVLDAAYRDYLSRLRFFADDPGRNVVLRLTVPFGVRPAMGR